MAVFPAFTLVLLIKMYISDVHVEMLIVTVCVLFVIWTNQS